MNDAPDFAFCWQSESDLRKSIGSFQRIIIAHERTHLQGGWQMPLPQGMVIVVIRYGSVKTLSAEMSTSSLLSALRSLQRKSRPLATSSGISISMPIAFTPTLNRKWNRHRALLPVLCTEGPFFLLERKFFLKFEYLSNIALHNSFEWHLTTSV